MISPLINNFDDEEANLSKKEKSSDFDSAPIIETQIPLEKDKNTQNIELIQTNIPPEEDNNNQNIQLIQTNIPPEEEKQNEKNEENYKKENLYKYSLRKKNKENIQKEEANDKMYQQKVINLREYNKIVIKALNTSYLRFIKVFLFVFSLATITDIIMQIILKSRGNNFIYDDLLYIIFFSIQCYYKERVYNSVKFFDIFFCVFFILNYLGIGFVILYCRNNFTMSSLKKDDYIYFFIPYSIRILYLPFTVFYMCFKDMIKDCKKSYCCYNCCCCN